MSEFFLSSSNPFPVEPTGFLVGSYFACILYGLHLTQLYTYFTRYTLDSLTTKAIVLWVWLLSSLQILIILATGWRYYVSGLHDPEIWGEFWWPLSFQDGLIPLMAFTAQVFFGKRAWLLSGRKGWIRWLFTVLPLITLFCGIALALTAHLWSKDPFVSEDEMHSRIIAVPSQIVAILWMGLSAITDGILTFILIYKLAQSGSKAKSIIWKLISLTLETVLLTHIVGATMCIIFLASPPARRTEHPLFWILLEIITELYALSMLFTINSRIPAKLSIDFSVGGREDIQVSRLENGMELRQTVLDRHVEGYQGSTPFGVGVGLRPGVVLPSVSYQPTSESSTEPLSSTIQSQTRSLIHSINCTSPTDSSGPSSLLTPAPVETADEFDNIHYRIEMVDESTEKVGVERSRKNSEI